MQIQVKVSKVKEREKKDRFGQWRQNYILLKSEESGEDILQHKQVGWLSKITNTGRTSFRINMLNINNERYSAQLSAPLIRQTHLHQRRNRFNSNDWMQGQSWATKSRFFFLVMQGVPSQLAHTSDYSLQPLPQPFHMLARGGEVAPRVAGKKK